MWEQLPLSCIEDLTISGDRCVVSLVTASFTDVPNARSLGDKGPVLSEVLKGYAVLHAHCMRFVLKLQYGSMSCAVSKMNLQSTEVHVCLLLCLDCSRLGPCDLQDTLWGKMSGVVSGVVNKKRKKSDIKPHVQAQM